MPENTVYVGCPTRWGNPHAGDTHTSMVKRYSESLHSGELGFTVYPMRLTGTAGSSTLTLHLQP